MNELKRDDDVRGKAEGRSGLSTSTSERLVAPRFHTIGGIAMMLQISERTVRRWIARGDLTTYKFGNVLRVSDDDLRRFFVRFRNG
jgi:excisionase family DNA binding protein